MIKFDKDRVLLLYKYLIENPGSNQGCFYKTMMTGMIIGLCEVFCWM
jgi:hypothetical protein